MTYLMMLEQWTYDGYDNVTHQTRYMLCYCLLANTTEKEAERLYWDILMEVER